MPKYEYLCKECSHTFIEVHLYKDVLLNCPECKAEGTLKKVLNTPVKLSYKKEKKDNKPGTFVKDAILSAKEEIDAHREELKQREIKK